jgi:nuclear transport factor 2 (NTF2) superfamily protein
MAEINRKWREQLNVLLHKLYVLPDIRIKERKEYEWHSHVE